MTQITPITPSSTTRSGMANMISTLRGMTNVGTASYTVNAVSYWTDLQLQDYLEKWRSDFYDREMQAVTDFATGGAVNITKYYIGSFNIESGTAVFWIENSEGTKLTETTDYTVDYALGLVTFNSNTDGKAYYATYRAYDLKRAAADVFRAKAAHYSDMYSFSVHGQSINKASLIKQALEMAQYYEQSAGAQALDLDRSDTC